MDSRSPLGSRIFRIALRTVGIAGLLGILVAILVGHGAPLEEGDKAPAVTATGLDGAAVDVGLGDGRLTVVNIWGTWCPPCLQELPELVKAAHRYEGKVRFVGLALESRREDVVRVAGNLAIPYDLARIDGPTAARWHADAVPDTYIIDGKGIVRWSVAGGIDGAILDEHLAPLLAP